MQCSLLTEHVLYHITVNETARSNRCITTCRAGTIQCLPYRYISRDMYLQWDTICITIFPLVLQYMFNVQSSATKCSVTVIYEWQALDVQESVVSATDWVICNFSPISLFFSSYISGIILPAKCLLHGKHSEDQVYVIVIWTLGCPLCLAVSCQTQ